MKTIGRVYIKNLFILKRDSAELNVLKFKKKNSSRGQKREIKYESQLEKNRKMKSKSKKKRKENTNQAQP